MNSTPRAPNLHGFTSYFSFIRSHPCMMKLKCFGKPWRFGPLGDRNRFKWFFQVKVYWLELDLTRIILQLESNLTILSLKPKIRIFLFNTLRAFSGYFSNQLKCSSRTFLEIIGKRFFYIWNPQSRHFKSSKKTVRIIF